MATEARHEAIADISQHDIKPPPRVYSGSTEFITPPVHAGYEDSDAYLGMNDLYLKFDGEDGWGFGLMEMLVDPMLVCWVPGWVRDQYERAKPYFRIVLNGWEMCLAPQNKI